MPVGAWGVERLVEEATRQGLATDGSADMLRDRILQAGGDPCHSWSIQGVDVPPFVVHVPVFEVMKEEEEEEDEDE